MSEIPGVGRAVEVYYRAARAGAKPDPKMLVSQWADQHRVLTTRSSPDDSRTTTPVSPLNNPMA